MTNVLPTPDFSKFFRTNINLGPVNSFYNSFNTKRVPLPKANLYKILTQRDQMETAFKYFEANEIFPTRAELLEKYEARVKVT